MFKKIPETADIRIIGPRASGKTTYLATLARLPHKRRLKVYFPGLKVEAINIDSQKLAIMAEDIIERGEKLAGDQRKYGNEPDYYFRITIPAFKGLRSVVIELNVRDFAGEIFEDDLPIKDKWSEIEFYLDDLFKAQGWMIMLTDWQPERDRYLYRSVFKQLCEEISNRRNNHLRLAVVMTKCERGEIWPGRLEPDEDLFSVRLPETYDLLTTEFPRKTNRLKFFACSSFGVLCDSIDDFDPRPNRYVPDDGSSSEFNAYLRNTTQWQPFGLLAPIYWLSTGQTLNDQRL